MQSSVEFDSETWPFRSTAEAAEKGDRQATTTNVHIFERAARCGNFEANIKLGVACLYGEGLDSSADLAYEMLNRAEEMVGSTFPFAWLLFRPPWSSDGCSKAAIFRSMKAQAEQNMHCWTKKYCGIMFCVAKTLSLQQGAEQKEEADRWFSKAAEKGCGDAAFELYQLRNRKASSALRPSRHFFAALCSCVRRCGWLLFAKRACWRARPGPPGWKPSGNGSVPCTVAVHRGPKTTLALTTVPCSVSFVGLQVHEMDIAQKVENIRYLREYESSGSWNVRVRHGSVPL